MTLIISLQRFWGGRIFIASVVLRKVRKKQKLKETFGADELSQKRVKALANEVIVMDSEHAETSELSQKRY